MIRVEGVTHAEGIVYYVSRDTVALIRLIFTSLKFLSAARCQFFFSIHLMMLIQRSKTCVMFFIYLVPDSRFLGVERNQRCHQHRTYTSLYIL